MTEMTNVYDHADQVEYTAEGVPGYDFGLELAAAAYHGHPVEAQGRAIALCCNHLLDGLHAGETLTIRLRGGDRFTWQLLCVEAPKDGREPLQARVEAALRLLPELHWAAVAAPARQQPPGYALIPDASVLIAQHARIGFGAPSSADDGAPMPLALMPVLNDGDILAPLCDHSMALPPDVWLSFTFRRQPLDTELDRRLGVLIDALRNDRVRRVVRNGATLMSEIQPAQVQRWLALCQETRAQGALTTLHVRASGATLGAAELGQLGCLAWPDRAVVGSSGGMSSAQALDLGTVIDSRALMRLWPSTAQLRALAFAPAFRAPLQAPSTRGTEIGHTSGKAVALGAKDMARHLHVLGATGAGKSTLLERLAATDIVAGLGVCVLDPHGDLYAALLERIPEARRDDLVLIDLCDSTQVPGLNFLQPGTQNERIANQQTANELLSIFERMYDMRHAGGPVFEQYLRHAVHLLTDSRIPGLTLCEIPVLFEDALVRRVLINHCTNPRTVSFWNEIAEKATGDYSVRSMAPT